MGHAVSQARGEKCPQDKEARARSTTTIQPNHMSESSLPRHFTATGFVVNGDATLLHWHHRVQAWLPPGGHVEPNEDPVQAALREVKEETGFDVELVPTQITPEISDLDQVAAPAPSSSKTSTTKKSANTSTST